MDISLAPEPAFHLGSFVISNSILTGWLITLVFLIFALLFRKKITLIPGRLQAFIEMIYGWLYDTALQIIQNENAVKDLFPYLLTLFCFIMISNWSGLLPGMGSIGFHELKNGIETFPPLLRAPTSDLNMVIVLALISMTYVQYLGIKYNGFKGYIGRFFNFKDPIKFFVGILEFIGEFTRIISFSFRLFGNVFAGEVLIGTMFFLTIKLMPYIPVIPLPFFLLEMFVGIIQAFIFSFLTIVFVALAVASHDEHEEGHANPHLQENLQTHNLPGGNI